VYLEQDFSVGALGLFNGGFAPDDTRRAEAIRMLLTGDGTAMKIAFMLGYSDQAHFTRAFRRWTGMAPREYRARFIAAAQRA